MKYAKIFLFVCFSILVGCGTNSSDLRNTNINASGDIESDILAFGEDVDAAGQALVVNDALTDKLDNPYYYPIKNYTTQRAHVFGQFVSSEVGYHTGEDITVQDTNLDVPVYALTDAIIIRKQEVAGLGGVVIVEFEETNEELLEDQVLHAIYGYMDLESVKYEVGNVVPGGTQLGVLADSESKHLHFGIYQYTGEVLFAEYVDDEQALQLWKSPYEFLNDQYIKEETTGLTTDDISEALNNVNTETAINSNDSR